MKLSHLLILIIATKCASSSPVPCSLHTDCGSCIQETSLDGNSCRWCRRDNQCYSSIFASNACSQAESVTDENANQCDVPLPVYNATIANITLAASAAAFYVYDDPTMCMSTLIPDSDFQVTQTVEVKCHNHFQADKCFGFNAVSHRERAIVIAFRGTTKPWNQGFSQAIVTLLYSKTPFVNGSVQNYFHSAFQNLWPQLEVDLIRLLSLHPDYSVWVTGFSLGGAIASVASTYIVHSGLANSGQVHLYTFGMPRVGDLDYALLHDRMVPNSWRIVRQKDPIPHLPAQVHPGMILGDRGNMPHHHGAEIYYHEKADTVFDGYIECRGRPFNEDPSCGRGDLVTLASNHIIYFGIKLGKYCNRLWHDDPNRIRRKSL